MATPMNLRKQEHSHEPTLPLAFELDLKSWKAGFVWGFGISGSGRENRLRSREDSRNS